MKIPRNDAIVKELNKSMKEAELLKDLKHEHIIGFEEAFISDGNE